MAAPRRPARPGWHPPLRHSSGCWWARAGLLWLVASALGAACGQGPALQAVVRFESAQLANQVRGVLIYVFEGRDRDGALVSCAELLDGTRDPQRDQTLDRLIDGRKDTFGDGYQEELELPVGNGRVLFVYGYQQDSLELPIVLVAQGCQEGVAIVADQTTTVTITLEGN